MSVAHIVKPDQTALKTEDGKDLMLELIRQWPGPWTLLRWRNRFNKVVAFDRLTSSTKTADDQTIVFLMDVDLVAKQGTRPSSSLCFPLRLAGLMMTIAW